MATFNVNENQLLMLGAAATKTTGGIDTLNVGEVGFFTPAGTRLTEATAATVNEFIMVSNFGGDDPVVSGVIKKASLKAAVRKAYVAETQQVDYIGFNGTSGEIVVTADNFYHVRLSLRQDQTSNHGGLYLKHGVYNSDVTATESEIAAGLHESLVNNLKRDPDQALAPTRLNSAAGAVITGTGNLSFVNGSKYFSAATDVDAVFVAGDYVRIGTAVGDPVYKIVSLDTTANTGMLDVAYQGASATVLEAAAEVIDVAAEATSAWGLKLEGQSLKFTTGKLHHNIAAWDLSIEGFGSTLLTQAATASIGSGSERYMKELEFFAQGNEGDFYRMGEPNIFPSRKDVSGNYSLITLALEEIYTGSIVSGPIKRAYTIAVPSTTPNYALDATANDITDVLEVLAFGSANGNLDLG